MNCSAYDQVSISRQCSKANTAAGLVYFVHNRLQDGSALQQTCTMSHSSSSPVVHAWQLQSRNAANPVLKRVQAAASGGSCHVCHKQDAAAQCSDKGSLCRSFLYSLYREQDLSLACNILYKPGRQALTNHMLGEGLLSGCRLQTKQDGK